MSSRLTSPSPFLLCFQYFSINNFHRQSFSEERLVFLHERSNGFYGPMPWILNKVNFFHWVVFDLIFLEQKFRKEPAGWTPGTNSWDNHDVLDFFWSSSFKNPSMYHWSDHHLLHGRVTFKLWAIHKVSSGHGFIQCRFWSFVFDHWSFNFRSRTRKSFGFCLRVVHDALRWSFD